MIGLPKPVRVPTQPKRIPRSSKPIGRKQRPRKEKKTPRAKLKKIADKLWSLIVKAGKKCQVCGSPDRLQAAHGFSRRYLGTRHDLKNGWCLCSGCHMRYTHDALGWQDIMRRDLGPLVYEDMRAQAQARCIPDYEAIIADLKAKVTL